MEVVFKPRSALDFDRMIADMIRPSERSSFVWFGEGFSFYTKRTPRQIVADIERASWSIDDFVSIEFRS